MIPMDIEEDTAFPNITIRIEDSEYVMTHEDYVTLPMKGAEHLHRSVFADSRNENITLFGMDMLHRYCVALSKASDGTYQLGLAVNNGSGTLSCGIFTGFLAFILVYSVDSQVSHNAVAKNVVRLGNFCSGVLLSERIVLTAAHCFDPPRKYEGTNFTVTLGDHQSGVAKIHINSRYLFVPGCHDTAIVLLKDPIHVPQQIPLACGIEWASNCSGYGYGVTENSNDKMVREVREVGFKDVVGGADACYNTTYVSKAKLCNGDSGGPAICNVGGQSAIIGVDTTLLNSFGPFKVPKCRSATGFEMTNSLGVLELIDQIPDDDQKYILNNIKTVGCYN